MNHVSIYNIDKDVIINGSIYEDIKRWKRDLFIKNVI